VSLKRAPCIVEEGWATLPDEVILVASLRCATLGSVHRATFLCIASGIVPCCDREPAPVPRGAGIHASLDATTRCEIARGVKLEVGHYDVRVDTKRDPPALTVQGTRTDTFCATQRSAARSVSAPEAELRVYAPGRATVVLLDGAGLEWLATSCVDPP
jgi:hypothetical protein